MARARASPPKRSPPCLGRWKWSVDSSDPVRKAQRETVAPDPYGVRVRISPPELHRWKWGVDESVDLDGLVHTRIESSDAAPTVADCARRDGLDRQQFGGYISEVLEQHRDFVLRQQQQESTFGATLGSLLDARHRDDLRPLRHRREHLEALRHQHRDWLHELHEPVQRFLLEQRMLKAEQDLEQYLEAQRLHPDRARETCLPPPPPVPPSAAHAPSASAARPEPPKGFRDAWEKLPILKTELPSMGLPRKFWTSPRNFFQNSSDHRPVNVVLNRNIDFSG